MRILGINGYHGDSSAALLEDGSLKFAVEEERFNRIKHWAGVPVKASLACASGNCIDHVAISRDPRAHLGAKLLRVALDPRLQRALPGERGEHAGRAGGIVARTD